MIHPSANLDCILPYPITDAVIVGLLKRLLTYRARGVSKSMITGHKNEFVLWILLRRLCCGGRLCLGGFCSIGHGIFAFFRDFSPLDPLLDIHINCRKEQIQQDDLPTPKHTSFGSGLALLLLPSSSLSGNASPNVVPSSSSLLELREIAFHTSSTDLERLGTRTSPNEVEV